MSRAIPLIDCAGMSNERWLECRAHGPKGDIPYTVGGSDVATIFGLSPWTTSAGALADQKRPYEDTAEIQS